MLSFCIRNLHRKSAIFSRLRFRCKYLKGRPAVAFSAVCGRTATLALASAEIGRFLLKMSQKPILGDPRPTQDELVALGRERLVSLHNEAVNRLEYVLKTFSRNLSPSALRVLRFKSNDDIDAIRSA